MRFLLYLLGFTALLYATVLLFIFLNIRRGLQWFSKPSPEGKFVDAHGMKLYYRVKGKGEPVVVVINAIGSAQAEWWPIQNEVGSKFRTITWERAGYGWSTPDENSRNAANIAQELDVILKSEKIKKPVFLVAQGTGSVYARFYAITRPQNVRGALFIDPLPVKYKHWLNTINEIEECPNLFEAALKKKKLATRGFYRLFPLYKGYKLDKRYKRDIIEHYARSENYDTMQLEYSQLESSLKEMEVEGDFPPIPLMVLYPSNESLIREWVRNGVPEYSARQLGRLHHELSGDILKISPKTTLLEVEKAGEHIHLSKPDIVVREILAMLGE